MGIDLVLDGGQLLATHSFTPLTSPHDPAGNGELLLLDATSLAEIQRIGVNAQPRRVAVDFSTGRAYLIGRSGGPAASTLVPVERGATSPGPEVPVGFGATDLAVDPGTGRLYLADARLDALRVFESDGTERPSIPVGADPTAVVVDPARARAYVVTSSPSDNRLVVVDLAAGLVLTRISFDVTAVVPQDLCVHPRTGEVFIACQGNIGSTPPSVFGITPESGAIRRFALTGPGRTIDIDPGLDQLWVAGEGRLHLLDASTGSLLQQTSFEGRPGRLVVDPRTGLAYVGERWTGRVVAYRSATPRPVPPPSLAVSSNAGRMNLFRQATDGTVESATWTENDDWSTFSSLGRRFPAGTRFNAVAPTRDTWWLFGVDDQGTLLAGAGTGQTVQRWLTLGSGFVPGADVAWTSAFAGKMLVFAVDASGTVRSFGLGADGLEGTATHSGLTVSPGAPIAAVSRKPEHWDLFVLAPDGRVYTQWWSSDEADFAPWSPLDGAPFVPGTRLSALGRKTDQLDLFAVAPNGQLVGIFWNNEQGWDRWRPVADGGTFPPGAPVAVINNDADNITLLAVGNDSQLWHTFWDRDDGWAPWDLMGGTALAPGAAITGVRRRPGELDVFWLQPPGPSGDRVGRAWYSEFQGRWSLQAGVELTVGMASLFYLEPIRTDKPVDGNLRIWLWENGAFLVKGHMEGSGFDPYDFVVQAAVPIAIDVAGFGAFVTYRAGHVGGWVIPIFGDSDRDYDWAEVGMDSKVPALFGTLSSTPDRRLIVSHSVKNDGIGGALDSLLGDVIQTLLLRDVVHVIGGTVLAAFALGREVQEFLGVEVGNSPPWLGLSIISGATGGLNWLAIPAAAVLLPMIAPVSGPVIGGRQRQMRPDEWAWAAQVFRGTLPPPERIFITNLTSARNTAFVSRDGNKFLVHMGAQAFEEPTLDTNTTSQGVPNAPGETFIHELTHVWDSFHSGPEWEFTALKAQIFRDGSIPDPNASWHELGIEEKARAIALWYRAHWQNLDGVAATSDPYFRFIRDHIWAESN